MEEDEVRKLRAWNYRHLHEKSDDCRVELRSVPQRDLRSVMDGVFADLALSTGLRISEMVSLRWRDVYNCTERKPKETVNMPARVMKGKKRARRVLINQTAAKALDAYYAVWHLLFLDACPPFEDDWLFGVQHSWHFMARKYRAGQAQCPTTNVGPAGVRTMQKRLGRMFEAAGLTRLAELSSHSFRKTFCARVYAATKQDPSVTMQFTGHASMNSLQRYLRPTSDAAAAVRRILEST